MKILRSTLPMVFGLLATGATASSGVAAAAAESCSVKLRQEPVVLRVAKDEFRIVFGVSLENCHGAACSGQISYQAAWKTENGPTTIDHKQLAFDVPNGASHSIAVDRQYFDTSESKHTTEVVSVSVDQLSCSSAGTALASR